MTETVFSALYFFLPGYVANMCPVIAGALALPGGRPISVRCLGEGKTWRGVYAAVFGAVLTVWTQRLLQESTMLESLRLVDYTSVSIVLLGVLLGSGAIGGDILKSFFKRQLGIARGRPWVPFDQLDFVIGGLVFVSPFAVLDWQGMLVLVFLTPLLHLATNVIGFSLGMKREWW